LLWKPKDILRLSVLAAVSTTFFLPRDFKYKPLSLMGNNRAELSLLHNAVAVCEQIAGPLKFGPYWAAWPKLGKPSPERHPRSKAPRPEITPLGKHLATPVNPALNERQPGVSEAAQAEFPPRSTPLHRPLGMSGVGCPL
jgi:hypothetical protein